MYPDRKAAEALLAEAEPHNLGPWGDHSRIAAHCAEAIARACGLDADKAYVLGLLHDIGRHLQYTRNIPHDQASAQLAEVILADCGFSKAERAEVEDAILQHRDSINGYRTGLIVIACADTNGRTGIVHKFVVRTAPAYRRVGSRCYIRRFKGMGAAHSGL